MDDGKKAAATPEELAKMRKGRRVAKKLRDIALALLAAELYLSPFKAWDAGGISGIDVQLVIGTVVFGCIFGALCVPYATGERKGGESVLGPETEGSALEQASSVCQLISLGCLGGLIICRWLFGIPWSALLSEWVTALLVIAVVAWVVASIAVGIRQRDGSVEGAKERVEDAQGEPNWKAAVVALVAVVLAIGSVFISTTGDDVIKGQFGNSDGYEIAAIEKMSAGKDPVSYGIAGTGKAAELEDELAAEKMSYKRHENGTSLDNGAVYTLMVISDAGKALSVTVSEDQAHFNGVEATYTLVEESELYELCKATFKEAKAKVGD